jgi:prevent-host-death family protein
MTIQLNIADAKACLSELIDCAEKGEDVVLARAGKPVARIVMARHGTSRASLFGALLHLGPVPDEAWSPEPLDAAYGFED